MKVEQNKEEKRVLFDDLLKPAWKKPRFWIYVGFSILVLIAILVVKNNFIGESISGKEIKESIRFFDISSQWIEKGKVNDEDFKGIVMVPQISFRVRNRGERELKYISFLAVFRALYEGKSMGEGLVTAFKDPLLPGNESKKIILNSDSGYRTPSKAVFKKMAKLWGKTVVEIYARSSNSKLIFLKSFFIRQIVEGLINEVKIK